MKIRKLIFIVSLKYTEIKVREIWNWASFCRRRLLASLQTLRGSYIFISVLLIKLIIRVLEQRCHVLSAPASCMLTCLHGFEEPSESITHNNNTGMAQARGYRHAAYPRGRLMQTRRWLPDVYCQNASGQLTQDSAHVLAAAGLAKVLVLLAVLREKKWWVKGGIVDKKQTFGASESFDLAWRQRSWFLQKKKKKYKVKDANRQTGSEVAEWDKEKGETEVLLPPCLTLKKLYLLQWRRKDCKIKGGK